MWIKFNAFALVSHPNATAQWAIRVGMPRKWVLWCQVRSPVHMQKVIPMKSKAYHRFASQQTEKHKKRGVKVSGR